MKKALAVLGILATGGMLLTGSAADWGKLIVNETDKLGKVIRSAGIKEE